jgi:hypothetical protein
MIVFKTATPAKAGMASWVGAAAVGTLSSHL